MQLTALSLSLASCSSQCCLPSFFLLSCSCFFFSTSSARFSESVRLCQLDSFSLYDVGTRPALWCWLLSRGLRRGRTESRLLASGAGY